MNKPISTQEFVEYLGDESVVLFEAIIFILFSPVAIVLFAGLKMIYAGYLLKQFIMRKVGR